MEDKIYAIRLGSQWHRSGTRQPWTPNLIEARLFTKLGQARGAHTRLCQLPGLSAEALRVVEFTLGNPRELNEAPRARKVLQKKAEAKQRLAAMRRKHEIEAAERDLQRSQRRLENLRGG